MLVKVAAEALVSLDDGVAAAEGGFRVHGEADEAFVAGVEQDALFGGGDGVFGFAVWGAKIGVLPGNR